MRDCWTERLGWAAVVVLAVAAVAAVGRAQRRHDRAAAPARDRRRPFGDPDRGRALITAVGCGACHDVPGLASARGRIGLSLDGVAGRAVIGVVVKTFGWLAIYLRLTTSFTSSNGRRRSRTAR